MYLLTPQAAHWLPGYGVWQMTIPTRGGRFVTLVADPHRVLVKGR